LRDTNLVRDRLAIDLESGDVDFNSLHCSLLALFDGAALGEAARKRWNGHQVSARRLRFHHDRVGAHVNILSQSGTQFVGRDARLSEDRPNQSGARASHPRAAERSPDRLDPDAASAHVILSGRPPPAQPAEGPDGPELVGFYGLRMSKPPISVWVACWLWKAGVLGGAAGQLLGTSLLLGTRKIGSWQQPDHRLLVRIRDRFLSPTTLTIRPSSR